MLALSGPFGETSVKAQPSKPHMALASVRRIARRLLRAPTFTVVAAALLTRAMSALLFGVGAVDPFTYAAVAVALGGTAVLASYVPARRAARVDPADALRWEA
jgi:hypothetical protein